MTDRRLFRVQVLAAIAIACSTIAARTSIAHEIRPALLEITETTPGFFSVTWKVPMRGDRVLGVEPVLPPSLAPIAPPSIRTVPGAMIQTGTYKSDGRSLIGESVSIDGLSALQTDALLRIQFLNGSSHTAILRPQSPSFQIPARASKREVAFSYGRMGMIHILEGVDHLLFLLALMFIVSGFWKLLKTVTAFTLAHSITLALATLGVVHVPSAPTEAIISLSIVFLAAEIIRIRLGEKTLTQRSPWIVAFAFGLFHGLGFAGALSEIGLPQHEIPLALLMFNVGVECGQVLFLLAVWITMAALRRARISWPLGTWRLAPYAIGSIAAFWTVQRVYESWS